MIQESYGKSAFIRSIPPFAVPACERAFLQAHRVIFGSRETSELYTRYNVRRNFRVTHNGLKLDDIDQVIRTLSKEDARHRLEVRSDRKVIISVGTVCARKDQATLAEALGLLARKRTDFEAYIVGAKDGDPHLRRVERILKGHTVDGRIHLVSETPDVHAYYRAADVFVLSSLNECFPLVILEAMAHGLPIVTTRCIGVSEQVQFGVNALPFEFSDAAGLAVHLETLLGDEDRRRSMGHHSREIFGTMQTYDEMVRSYEQDVLSAWHVGYRGP